MKKIMILAAVALAAVVTNAATVKWSGSGIKGTDGLAAGNTYTAYFFIAADTTGTFDTMTVDAAIAAISEGDFSGAVASKALISGMIAPVTASKTTTSAGMIDTFGIVVNADASQYLVLGTKTLDCSDPTSTQTASWATFNNTAADWQTAAVPEPTSGLLLLLGMAGLALRRKIA